MKVGFSTTSTHGVATSKRRAACAIKVERMYTSRRSLCAASKTGMLYYGLVSQGRTATAVVYATQTACGNCSVKAAETTFFMITPDPM